MMNALFVFKTGVRLKYWVYTGGGEGWERSNMVSHSNGR